MTQRYDAERMLDRDAFGSLGSTAFLHGQRPSVLELDRPLALTADLNVSSHHARICHAGGDWYLTDCAPH